MAKLPNAQKAVIDAMKAGETLTYTRNRIATRGTTRHYTIGKKEVLKATVASLEKKGLIKTDYTKSTERVSCYTITNVYPYILTDAGMAI